IFIILHIILIPLFLNSILYNNKTIIEENKKKDDNYNLRSSDYETEKEYFLFQRNITIDHNKVVDDVYDFPLMVSIIDTDLREDVKTEFGEDIVFSDGTKWLYHEIEYFNKFYNSTHAKLVAWVRVDHIDDYEDTVIIMFYGNSTMISNNNPEYVWNYDYRGVWHLNGNPSETVYDSTSRDRDGFSQGGMSSEDQKEGKIDGSFDFDGINDHINLGNIDSNYWSDLTLEAWIKIDISNAYYQRILSKEEGSGGGPYIWNLCINNNYLAARITTEDSYGHTFTTAIDSPGGIGVNTWHHIALTWDGYNVELFIDGNEVAHTTNQGSNFEYSSVDAIIGDIANKLRPFDGMISEVRILDEALHDDWIKTEYRNQNDPNSFYTLGDKISDYVDLKIDAIDLDGNKIPNVNVSIYRGSGLISSAITNRNGQVQFSEIENNYYNFTVKLNSNIENKSFIVNQTQDDILIDNNHKQISLKCNIKSEFFEILDIDNQSLESGWIIVENSTNSLMKCNIINGKSQFSWLDQPSTNFSYTIYYHDSNYNPSTINLANGSFSQSNQTIVVQVNLTQITFTITGGTEKTLVSGANLFLNRSDNGDSIGNLNTNINGTATLRWLNSYGLVSGEIINYSLSIYFFGYRSFNGSSGGIPPTYEFTLNKSVNYQFNIDMGVGINPSDYKTDLILLNPHNITDYIVEWGNLIQLRVLFNITNAPESPELLGFSDADYIKYDVIVGGEKIRSDEFSIEAPEKDGYYNAIIDTKYFESNRNHRIEISAFKSGFTPPPLKTIWIFPELKHLILNESLAGENPSEIYWRETANFSLSPYGIDSESFSLEHKINLIDENYFEFYISEPSSDWNISLIKFDIHNITFGAPEENINLTIVDPYGMKHNWDKSNASYYYESGDPGNGRWNDLWINLYKSSLLTGNNFNFTIYGTFINSIDIDVESTFIRDKINIQYYLNNVTSDVHIPYDENGWIIRSINFQFYNCFETNTWTEIDPSNYINNISTIEGVVIEEFYNNYSGGGSIRLDNTFIFPRAVEFIFIIGNMSNIIFDLILDIEFVKKMEINPILEEEILDFHLKNYQKNMTFVLSPSNSRLIENNHYLLIENLQDINHNDIMPSEINLKVNLNGREFYVLDGNQNGTGYILLEGIEQNKLYAGYFISNNSLHSDLILQSNYERIITYDINGNIEYEIEDIFFGSANYDPYYRDYRAAINTSVLDSGKYYIRFLLNKINYDTGKIEFNINILDRLTKINNSTQNNPRYFYTINVWDSLNFSFSYTDLFSGKNITGLDVNEYIWDYFTEDDIYLMSGEGELIYTQNGEYVLDFNSHSRQVGTYVLGIELGKKNYVNKKPIVYLTVLKRNIKYTLSDNIKNGQLSVPKGKSVSITLNLTDSSSNDLQSITNATITLNFGSQKLNFTEQVAGIYNINIPTGTYDTFFSPQIISATIEVYKENYVSQQIDFVIIIEMEQIFPGLPTFYFLLIISSLGAISGAIATYKGIKYAKIPQFVKDLRKIKKLIGKNQEIGEDLAYPSKEAYILNDLYMKLAKIGLTIKKRGDLKKYQDKFETLKNEKVILSEKSRDIFPKGMVLMHWDERKGAETLSEYPEEMKLSSETLMQVYSSHEYSGTIGMTTLMVGSLNIASYYSGEESRYYLILVLNPDDDPDIYEDALADAIRLILANREDDSYLEMIPNIFRRISVYPGLNEEQMLIYLYNDNLKRMVFNYLREQGVVLKSELEIWLKDAYKEGFFNLDNLLLNLIKRDLMREGSFKGISSSLLYLIGDIFMVRVPPIKLLNNSKNWNVPVKIKEDYPDEIIKFFKDYQPTEQDNIKIIKALNEPQVYETFKLLRNSISTIDDMRKLEKKGVSDIYHVLKVLWDANLIKVFQDKEGNEYYGLLSNFNIGFMFPKYILSIIKKEYEFKRKSVNVLLNYLDLLEREYMNWEKEK
ncbi:MAG: LamG domain-containing protein, partial [Promethearchaeota archaeon]